MGDNLTGLRLIFNNNMLSNRQIFLKLSTVLVLIILDNMKE